MSKNFDLPATITSKIIDFLATWKEDNKTPVWQKLFHGSSEFVNGDGRPYRGINTLLLAVSGLGKEYSPVWLTYNKAAEIGGQVRKGEKSTMVVFWKRYENAKPCTCGPRGHRYSNGNCEHKKAFVLRYFSVFNTAQIDGEMKFSAKVQKILNPPDSNHNDPIASAENIIGEMPNPPMINYSRDGKAYYVPRLDVVHLPEIGTCDSAEVFYTTAFHELVHSTGADTRLDRHEKDHIFRPFGSEDYSKEELVAEIGAAFLCGKSGIVDKTLENSAAYIASWMKKLKDEPMLIVSAASQAQKAYDYILGYDPSTQVEEGEE